MLGVVSRALRAGSRVAGGVRRGRFKFDDKSPGSSTSSTLPFTAAATATAVAASIALMSEGSRDRNAPMASLPSMILGATGRAVVSCEATPEPAIEASTAPPDTIPVDKLACHRVVSGDVRRGERPQPVVLVFCGSFNPPTVAHLKILDMVREAYMKSGVDVYGAYMSPVHNEYGKKGLIDSRHRVEMCELAAAPSTFVMVDGWEAAQAGYTRTLHVLDSVDARLRAAEQLTDEARGSGGEEGTDGCLPRTVLVCGADVLESMADPDVWDQKLLEELLRRHGVACVVRKGTDMRKALETEGTLVSKWRKHILVVEAGDEDMEMIDGVSSTRVRGACRGEGERDADGLVDDEVWAYIKQEMLYER